MSTTEIAERPEVVVLAAASAHTPKSADDALRAFGFDDSVLAPLRMFGFITHSAGEWQFEPGLRKQVLANVSRNDDLWLRANRHYLSLAGSSAAGTPAYLATGAGRAYHSTELSPATGAREYRDVADVDSLAINIQGLTLAEEQTERGLIEVDSTDVLFLRAMTAYRSQREAEAIALFREFLEHDDESREAAIAQHLVAHWDCQHTAPNKNENFIPLFKKSLRSGVRLKDSWHQAQVLHSTALCIAKQKPKNVQQAIKLLLRSLDLLTEADDQWGRAKVLHSLGQILGRMPGMYKQAHSRLAESRQIGLDLGYEGHVRQVDASMSALKDRKPSESSRRRVARKQQEKPLKNDHRSM
ncbi:tetratricopeptide (TPR) repeat protein [Microbacterium phyllosphaerae]|uniref:Tetratricopeptide (TPR) repeat protein n=1 Tax=Microbacterium phyllosphaerae TaxID=124798 RepID=A0ABS4WLW4_9MICO|nr:hypothetical protein [Microbacterium phyllosphaerae]MBP2377021.1 tetratricopeptide (TPR) repeat protein [Microbacterium phyllosphaerae]